MKAVILAGGIGSRLWPLSRELYPKQLLRLNGEDSLLQATVKRAVAHNASSIMVVASHAHRFYVREQIDELSITTAVQIILEPMGRNTAPAIALAAMLSDANESLWVMPADHVLLDTALMQRLAQAECLAAQAYLVTFGIQPQYPETGYGYIERGQLIAEGAFEVASFKEKPSKAIAQDYCDRGDYAWNSGMFYCKAGAYLAELKDHQPDLYAQCQQTVSQRFEDLGFIKFPKDVFAACADISVDYAVMEHTAKAAVIPLQAEWSDIGSWQALYDLEKKDAAGNVLSGDVIAVETKNSLVHASSRLVATIGLDHVVVIETADAVLVADLSKVQSIKEVVKQLGAKDRDERKQPQTVYRPWGRYDVLVRESRFELRLVKIKPGGVVGPHQHSHREQRWTVLEGEVCATLDHAEVVHQQGEHFCAPAGVSYVLTNSSDQELILAEFSDIAACLRA